jgi:GNAT superfamily N-acetyltransferase
LRDAGLYNTAPARAASSEQALRAAAACSKMDAMGDADKIEIQPLGEGDLAEAMRLKELARWNQTEADWRRLLRLEPRGCFAAWLDGRIVATTTTTSYGQDLAWIGMVLVDPAYRRRGIATRLMRAALDYLRGLKVATVKLDATPAGQPVYEALGFVREGLVERWEGVAPQSLSQAERLDAATMASVLALDRAAFGADRAGLLRSLAEDACVAPTVVRSGEGSLRGYALARRGTAADYVGPLVAEEANTALALLDATLAQLAGRRVYLDLHAGGPLSAAHLGARGFSKQRDLIRMRSGDSGLAGTSPLVALIAGPEVG